MFPEESNLSTACVFFMCCAQGGQPPQLFGGHLMKGAPQATRICCHNPAAFSVREAPRCVRLLHGHSHGNGYAREIHRDVVAKARDCSLDALRSIGPVTWESICK